MINLDLTPPKTVSYSHMLAGKKVFVSTASQGIGKAIAVLLAQHGATIAMGGRNAAKLKTAVEEVCAYAPNSKGYACDLGDQAGTEQACEKILSDFGAIDVLINTVGINQMYSIHQLSDEALETMLSTNYKSGLYCARKLLPEMLRQKSGNIVNISSVHSVQTSSRCGIYAGTKAAMEATARAMAIDYAPYGIRVNTIVPGLILSDVMTDSIASYPEGKQREQYIQKLHSIQPLPPGRVEDVANAALFLASDMSSFITGQTLIVDGGACITNKW